MQTKKGFILIYTILIGLICLVIMMSIFDIYMTEVKYTTSSKRTIAKDDNYQKNKEYLMTLFFACINANSEEIENQGINKFFPGSESSIVNYGRSKVTHPNLTNEFLFTTPYDSSTNRKDYFKLEIINESFKLVFLRTGDS